MTDEQLPDHSTDETIVARSLSRLLLENSDLEPYLVILSGVDRAKQFKLERQTNIFGRSDEVHITLSDPEISRCHGAIVVHPDAIVLEDYQSTNGTFVDGMLVNQKKLDLMSRIRVGNTDMKIDFKNPVEVKSEHELYSAAYLDPLTQIFNRRSFTPRAQEERIYCRKKRNWLTVALCDVDHFKQKNDTFGHLAGDQILIDLAKILTVQMRKKDLLARFGGEEFIMLFPNTDVEQALTIVERIRNVVLAHPFEYQGQAMPTTVSIGVCSRQGEEISSLDSLIEAADKALYRAKETGRNRVFFDKM